MSHSQEANLCASCGHPFMVHAPRPVAEMHALAEDKLMHVLATGEPYRCWAGSPCRCGDFVWKPGEFFGYAQNVMSTSAEPNAGLRTVRDAYRTMQIDMAWTEVMDPEPNGPIVGGFSWWPGQLVQKIWSTRPTESEGTTLSRLYSYTDLVKDIEDHDRVEQMIVPLNMSSVLSAYVYDREERTLRLRSSAYVHDGNIDWLSNLFSLASALQVDMAHAKVEAGLAEIVGGTPALSSMPKRPARTEPDEIMGYAEVIAAHSRQKKMALKDEHLDATRQVLADSCPLFQWKGCLTVLVPLSEEPDLELCGRNSPRSFENSMRVAAMKVSKDPAAMVEVLWQSAQGDIGKLIGEVGHPAALLTIDIGQQHPQFGHGALMLLNVPVFRGEPESVALANEMNYQEDCFDTRAHGFGAWAAPGGGRLTHALFVPAGPAAGNPSWLPNLALSELVLARWAWSYFVGGRSGQPRSMRH